MTDLTIDVSGPGARLAALAAEDAETEAVRAAEHSGTAAGFAGVAKAAALTASGVYATKAAGIATVADGATFWAQSSEGAVTLYRRAGATASLITSLGSNTPMNLSSFNAIPDAKTVRSGKIAAGSQELLSTLDVFGPEDVGKLAIVALAGQGGGKLRTTIVGYTSPRQVTIGTPAITGVDGNGGAVIGTDCGPALQAALDAVEAQAGGELVIDGAYLLATPVQLNARRAQHLRISGTGGNSGIIIAGQPTDVMITLIDIGRLRIDGVNFAGCPREPDDCTQVLSIYDSFAVVENCGFFGLARIYGPDGAAILAERSELVMRRNEFGGCVFSSGYDNAVVRARVWKGFSDEGSRFIDYGSWGGNDYSKTGIAFSGAWISVGSPQQPKANAVQSSVVRLTDTRFDEGHVAGVAIIGTTSRITRVHLSGIQANNTLVEGGSAMYVQYADEVLIEQCAVGFTGLPRNAVFASDCRDVQIDTLHLSDKADGIRVVNTQSLTIRNSPELKRLSLENVASFSRSDRGAGGQVVFTKAGRVTDADFSAPPAIGTIAADIANRKLYLRTASGWLATAALAPSNDALLALINATPATGELVAGDTYRKTSGGDVWGNCSANLPTTVTGDFRMRVKFATATDETYVRVGAIDATTSADAAVSREGIVLGILQDDATNIYFISGGTLVGPFPYTAGQECELISNASTGAVTMSVNGAQVFSEQRAFSADFVHRFGSTLYSVGAEFQLLEYAPL